MIEQTMIHPETGETLYRDIRPVELTYKGESITVNQPGWYQLNGDDAIFSQEDMVVHDKALRILKARHRQKLQATDLEPDDAQHSVGLGA